MSVPEIKYGKKVLDSAGKPSWQWSNIQSPIRCSEKVKHILLDRFVSKDVQMFPYLSSVLIAAGYVRAFISSV